MKKKIEGELRKVRTCRFSDAEWLLIRKAAAAKLIPAGELLRQATLAEAKKLV